MFAQALLAILLSLFISELAKRLIQFLRQERIRMLHLGGMPSTHATVVSALFLSVYIETGPSILLLACAVFGAIVLRDALSLRWEVSRHSDALNKLMRTKTYESIGHQYIEVFAGVLLGLVITIVVYWAW